MRRRWCDWVGSRAGVSTWVGSDNVTENGNKAKLYSGQSSSVVKVGLGIVGVTFGKVCSPVGQGISAEISDHVANS